MTVILLWDFYPLTSVNRKTIAYFKSVLNSSLSDATNVVCLGVTYNVFSQIPKFKETLLEGLKKYQNSVKINKYLQLVFIQFLDMKNFRKATETLDKLKKYNNNNEEYSIFYILYSIDGYHRYKSKGTPLLVLK